MTIETLHRYSIYFDQIFHKFHWIYKTNAPNDPKWYWPLQGKSGYGTFYKCHRMLTSHQLHSATSHVRVTSHFETSTHTLYMCYYCPRVPHLTLLSLRSVVYELQIMFDKIGQSLDSDLRYLPQINGFQIPCRCTHDYQQIAVPRFFLWHWANTNSVTLLFNLVNRNATGF